MLEWAKCLLLSIKTVLFCSGIFAHSFMNKNLTLIVVDDFHPIFLESLNKDIQVEYLPNIAKEEIIALSQSFNIMAVRSKINLTQTALQQLPNLKCIARGGAGMDNIDEAFAKSKNITLLNAPEGNRDAVAEHTMALLLALSNNIVKSNNEVKNFEWRREENRGWEIGGKTVGIIGFGNTGGQFAKRLSGFDCNVIAYDKYQTVDSPFAKAATLQEIQKKADIISLHIPLTPETNQFVNAGFLNQCKKNVVLINTSRGGILNPCDVENFLNRGKIKSVGLDVYENENLGSFSEGEKALFVRLMSNSQVVITPHVAGWTKESYYKIGKVLAQKINDFSINFKKNQLSVD